MSIDLLLYIVAFILFLLSGLNVTARVNLQSFGLAALALSLIV